MTLLCFYHRHSCTRFFSFFKAHRWLLMVVFMASLFLIHVHSVPLLVTHHCLFCFVVTAWTLCTLTSCILMILLFAVLAVFFFVTTRYQYTVPMPRLSLGRRGQCAGRGHPAGARRRRARAHSRRHDDGHSLGPLAFGLAWMVVSVVLNPGILRRISR